MPDRINYFSAFRLGPWNREISIACIERLSENCGLAIEDGVSDAVYESLGIGIPHHVQSFFARLRSHSMMRQKNRITVADVAEVYQTELLGASGQYSLMHYETRLQDGLDAGSYPIAMEILAEAATQGSFSPDARRCLEKLYAPVDAEVAKRVSDTLGVLLHDGYLEEANAAYRFPSYLLKDWWAARFQHHHTPLAKRHVQ